MFDLEIISAFLGNGFTEDCFQESLDCRNKTQEYLNYQETGYTQSCDILTATSDNGRVTLDSLPKTNIAINTLNDDIEQSFFCDSQSDSFCIKRASPGNNSANETDSSASEESLFYGFYSGSSDSRLEFYDFSRQTKYSEGETSETCASGEQTTQGSFHSKYSDTSFHSDSQNNKRLPNYVRMGATIRERTRMHMLNDAFDDLRKVIPRHNVGDHQKLSKIATLRLAIQYIKALVSTLQTSGVEIEKVKGYCVGDRRGKRRNSRKRFY